jgi:hypothetical protein
VLKQKRKEVERAFNALGWNFDVNIGRDACEACSATWNLATNLTFALGPRKRQRILIKLECWRAYRMQTDLQPAVRHSST